MALTIKTWSGFSKRVNSTKQPLDTAATSHTVLLKEGADLKKPVFELNTLDLTINYVQAFGLYYFAYVENIDGHRCNIVCTIDYMATFKTEVGAYRGLIEYTSSASDLMITDPRNVPTNKIAHAQSLSDLSWTCDSAGTYILGVLGSQGGPTGMTTYYSMNAASFILFMNEAFSTGIIDDIINDFNGVQNCVVSCFWVPLDRSWVNSHFSGFNEAIQIGRCQGMTAQGYKLTSRLYTESDDLQVAFNTSYSAKTYLHKAPFCTGNIYLPFCGSVPLDLDLFADDPNIVITMTLDILTGDIIYYVSQDAGWIVSSYSGNCASKIPVSGASFDGIGVLQGISQAVIGGTQLMAGDVRGLGSVMSAGMGTVRSLQLHSQGNGAISSAAQGGYSQAWQVKVNTYIQEPTETNLTAWQAEQGMPYFKVATVSSLSGYVKCANASVSIPGDGEEQNVLNGYLNGGFYYE